MKYRSLLLFFTLVFISNNYLNANALQDTTRYTAREYSLGITPTSILNSAAGIQFNQRLTFSNQLVLGLESAYIFEFLDSQAKNVYGVRLRPSISLLLPLREKSYFSIGAFYNYRKIFYDQETQIYKADAQYIETVKGDVNNVFKGLGLMAGIKILSGRLEYNFGIGFGSGKYKSESSNPQLMENLSNNNFWFRDRGSDSFLPISILHFGLNYRFI